MAPQHTPSQQATSQDYPTQAYSRIAQVAQPQATQAHVAQGQAQAQAMMRAQSEAMAQAQAQPLAKYKAMSEIHAKVRAHPSAFAPVWRRFETAREELAWARKKIDRLVEIQTEIQDPGTPEEQERVRMMYKRYLEEWLITRPLLHRVEMEVRARAPARVAQASARAPAQVAQASARAPGRAAQAPAHIAQVQAQVAQAPTKVAQAPATVAQAPAQVAQAPTQVAQAPAQVAQAPTQVVQAPAQAPAQVAQAPAQVAQAPAQAPAQVAQAPTQVAQGKRPDTPETQDYDDDDYYDSDSDIESYSLAVSASAPAQVAQILAQVAQAPTGAQDQAAQGLIALDQQLREYRYFNRIADQTRAAQAQPEAQAEQESIKKLLEKERQEHKETKTQLDAANAKISAQSEEIVNLKVKLMDDNEDYEKSLNTWTRENSRLKTSLEQATQKNNNKPSVQEQATLTQEPITREARLAKEARLNEEHRLAENARRNQELKQTPGAQLLDFHQIMDSRPEDPRMTSLVEKMQNLAVVFRKRHLTSKLTEEPKSTGEPKLTEKPKPAEEPKPSKEPKLTEKSKLTEEPKSTGEPTATKEPKPTKEPEPTKEPKLTEKSKLAKEPKPTKEPSLDLGIPEASLPDLFQTWKRLTRAPEVTDMHTLFDNRPSATFIELMKHGLSKLAQEPKPTKEPKLTEKPKPTQDVQDELKLVRTENEQLKSQLDTVTKNYEEEKALTITQRKDLDEYENELVDRDVQLSNLQDENEEKDETIRDLNHSLNQVHKNKDMIEKVLDGEQATLRKLESDFRRMNEVYEGVRFQARQTEKDLNKKLAQCQVEKDELDAELRIAREEAKWAELEIKNLKDTVEKMKEEMAKKDEKIRDFEKLYHL